MEPSIPPQVDLLTSIIVLGASGLLMLAISTQIDTLNQDISQLSQSIASLKLTYAGRSVGLEIDSGAETQFDYVSLPRTFLHFSEKMPDPCFITKRQGKLILVSYKMLWVISGTCLDFFAVNWHFILGTPSFGPSHCCHNCRFYCGCFINSFSNYLYPDKCRRWFSRNLRLQPTYVWLVTLTGCFLFTFYENCILGCTNFCKTACNFVHIQMGASSVQNDNVFTKNSMITFHKLFQVWLQIWPFQPICFQFTAGKK